MPVKKKVIKKSVFALTTSDCVVINSDYVGRFYSYLQVRGLDIPRFSNFIFVLVKLDKPTEVKLVDTRGARLQLIQALETISTAPDEKLLDLRKLIPELHQEKSIYGVVRISAKVPNVSVLPGIINDTKTTRRVLALDPAQIVTGYFVSDVHYEDRKIEIEYIASGEFSSRPADSNYHSLDVVYREITKLLQTYRPDQIAMEAAPFTQQTSSVWRQRTDSVIALACIQQGIIPCEYLPSAVYSVILGKAGHRKTRDILKALTREVVSNIFPGLESAGQDSQDAIGIGTFHSLCGTCKQRNNCVVKKTGVLEFRVGGCPEYSEIVFLRKAND